MGEPSPIEESFLLLPGDGLLLARASGEVCFLDSTARELMGGGTTDFTGETLEEAWPELAGTVEACAAALAASGPQDRDVPRAASGRQVRVRIFRSDDGVGVGLLVPREPAPRTDPTLPLLESILREVRDGVIVTTAEPIEVPGPVILFANHAVLEQTGYSLREVLGRSPRLFQGPGTELGARAALRQGMRAWQPVRRRLLNYTRSGEPFEVELSLAPVADEQGWYTHWVAVQRETTPRPVAQPPAIPIALC